jgi:hypothetical protein
MAAHMSTTRTTFILPTQLHQRLFLAAKEENKTVSDLVREVLAQFLTFQEQHRIKRMYEALEKVRGIGPREISDASTTIDETLYGEHGAWRPAQE